MRNKSGVEFYNADTETLACNALEEYWPTAHRFGTKGGTAPTPDIRDCGRKSPMLWRGDAETGCLGVRPILWALLILNRYDSDKTVTIQSQSPTLDDSIYEAGALNPNGTAVPADAEIVDCLQQLIRKGRVGGYREDRDPFYFIYFAGKVMKGWYTRTSTPCPPDHELLKRAGEAWLKLKNDVCPKTIAEAFPVLRSLLPAHARYTPVAKQEEEVQDFSRGKHVIPDGTWDYIGGVYAGRTNPPKPVKTAERIIKHLTTDRAVLLHGPVNAGKSSVVVEILRKLARETTQGNTIRLSVPGADLPVCIINARAHSDRDVALRVLAFLEFLEPKNNSYKYKRIFADLEQELRGGDRITDLETLYERLGKACKTRAGFFIFTNWDEQGDSSPRSMMRDQSKAGLIRLLHDGHNKTRVLLSTLGADRSPDKRVRSKLPYMKKLEMQDPVFSQVERYWPGLVIEDPAQRDAIEELKSRIGEKKQLPGAHLMLIAVLIQLAACHDNPISNRAALKPLLPTLATYLATVNDGKKDRNRLQQAVRPLVRALLAELNSQHLLRIVLAIASSDDGLRPKSLQDVLTDWAEQSKRPFARTTPLKDVEEILVGLASNFFIRKTPSADRNAAQLDFGEDAGKRDEQFELNQTLREMIFAEIFHEENDGLRLDKSQPTCVQWCREAQRHVAARSRKRGRNWRLNARMATLTRNWRDYLPDMQAYESLLASLDPAAFSDLATRVQAGPQEALVHRELDVFRQAKDYDHLLALRFAVNCLLQSEIDRNGRLSMLYDQDDLRKKLCLAPFLELGRKHFVGANELGRVVKLPDELPAHVRAAFLPSEIVDMLTSVAIAALHSQCSATLNWAWTRFFDILREAQSNDRKKLVNRGVRILCSAFDMSIMQGSPIWFGKGANGNHGDTLGQLRTLLKPEDNKLVDVGEIDVLFGNPSCSSFGEDSIANGLTALRHCLEYDGEQPPLEIDTDTLASWLRLKVREAMLLDCHGSKEIALLIYDMVHRVEALVGELRRNAKSLVLDGRLARQETLAFLTSPAFLSKGQDGAEASYATAERRIRSLLNANVARLSRFGGAEQAATLMTLALFEALRHGGDLEDALRLATRSRNAVENDQASLSMHSQILAVQTQINVMLLERNAGGLSRSRLYARAQELLKDADLLVRIAAVGLEHRPTAARAYAFKGKINMLLVEYLGDHAAVFEARDALEEAIRLLDASEHTLYDVDVQEWLNDLNGS